MNFEDCVAKIKSFTHNDLIALWYVIKDRNTGALGWPAGKAFELLILRAFQLEGAEVVWPYSVELFRSQIEQIDGVVHITALNLSVLVESKDQDTGVNIEPIAKMRNQLQRRPTGVIGSVFSVNGFTEPALTLAQFVFPQTVLLWNPQDIEYSLQQKAFIHHLRLKYRHCIEHGSPDLNIVPIP